MKSKKILIDWKYPAASYNYREILLSRKEFPVRSECKSKGTQGGRKCKKQTQVYRILTLLAAAHISDYSCFRGFSGQNDRLRRPKPPALTGWHDYC
jgi:hypothetical protein